MTKRKKWLEDMGVEEKDVMSDEYGTEFIMSEPSLMDEGENEDGRMRKVFLPDEICVKEN